ncbi:MAG TPA: class I SAM-dependent methyltransferase [Ignavibacteriales bacterium]|nr:class I SAM-dependent methyltransferase [Ignavibacteriales bacterium]
MQDNERLTEFYDGKYRLEAQKASDDYVKLKKYPNNRLEACLKYFPQYFNGGDILELGAGSGTLARSFINAGMSFKSYTISDFSNVRVEGLRKSVTDPRIKVEQINCDDIPVESLPKYDAVIMVALIEHLVDPLGAMQKVRQILKPGGIVYIDTPNMALYHRRLKLLRGIFPSTSSTDEGLITYYNKPVDLFDEGHLHYFTYRSLSKMLLTRCGFTSVEKLGYSIKVFLSEALEDRIARLRPELFSELALIARA